MAKTQRERSLQAVKDVKDTFGTEHGKRVLKGLMQEAGMFSAVTPKTGDEAIALCAKRELVTALIQTMKMNEDKLLSLFDEEQYA